MKKIVKIEAKNSASRRTKNRIHQHGPFFILVDKAASVQSLSGNAGILVECWGFDPVVPNQNTDWLGWLPTDEVEIKD